MAKHKGIFQRGNVYWVRYTDIYGKQIRESAQSEKLKDAQNLLKTREAEVLKGENPEILKIKNTTFAELAVDYLEFCKKQKGHEIKTLTVNKMVREFGHLPLKNFTTMFVEKYQSRLVSEPRKAKAGSKAIPLPLSESTANRYISTIKGMFTKAYAWKMVSGSTNDQVHDVEMFAESGARDKFLSSDEIQRLIVACSTNVVSITGKAIELRQGHLLPMIIFALNTGCRRGEIFSLKWENVDLVHGFINLIVTKNGDRRQIPISDTLNEILKNLPRKKGVEWVFHHPETGSRFTTIKKSFATACKKAGIHGFVFHGLRHTFASHLVMSGVDLTTVSRLLGHRSLTMTLRYSHLAPNHLNSAISVLKSSMCFSTISTVEEKEENTVSTILAQNEKQGLKLVA